MKKLSDINFSIAKVAPDQRQIVVSSINKSVASDSELRSTKIYNSSGLEERTGFLYGSLGLMIPNLSAIDRTALLGVWTMESQLRSTIYAPSTRAIGLGQWHKERFDTLITTARTKFGPDAPIGVIGDPILQINHALWEDSHNDYGNRSNFSRWIKELQQADGLEAKVRAFTHKFEGLAPSHPQAHITKRLAFASKVKQILLKTGKF